MSEKTMRLSQVARKLNVGTSTIVEHLAAKGYDIDNKPNTKISVEQYNMLFKEFQSSADAKEEASELTIGKKHSQNLVIESEGPISSKKEDNEEAEITITNLDASKKEDIPAEPKVIAKAETESDRVKLQGIKVVGKIDLDQGKKTAKKEQPKVVEKPAEKQAETKPEPAPPAPTPEPEKKPEPESIPEPVVAKKEEVKEEVKVQTEEKPKPKDEVKTQTKEESPKEEEASVKEVATEPEMVEAKADSLKGLTVLGKIELPAEKKKTGRKDTPTDRDAAGKRKRKRVRIEKPVDIKREKGKGRGKPKADQQKEEISQKQIQEKIKATLARMGGGKVDRSKYRKEKRSAQADAREEELIKQEEEKNILRVTEFISANDLASLLNVSVNEIISMCMSLGMFVSINQRLDAETITLIADEFDYIVEFTTQDEEESEESLIEEDETLLEYRSPVVTIMGHVDHGKTSLLDYIRSSKIADKEAGGITQHIGAYSVETDSGKRIAFLDTPGHEAFTAMRARGAKVTDIVILVVAADDDVMPQTKEAINHAQVAGVPIVIALNKIDKPNANPDKIKEALSKENILVEDWGGKYQCQEVSAKKGLGITELLEKVLLEAELLELKANPNKLASGTVVEASLDKGRGYLATLLVQTGTLRIGDIVVAGPNHGRVKAMMDHLGNKLEEAGPSTPIQLLGLDGAPQAGDKFSIAESEREARDVTTKRAQLLREQSVRTKKHLTLDEIGRRLAIGNFKELNLIIKGDMDGSVEALSDSLLKLSTEEVQVNIIHKGVGQITESDVLLATASDAIICGFQVRPSGPARTLAENEDIEVRLYSVIYKAIDEMKDALEGLLEPTVEEVIMGNIEVREVYKITKIGTIAGCYVKEGVVKRNNPIRIIRDGIVIHEGAIEALKRFKDDVSEVKHNYECGIRIKGFNDIKVDDIIETYEEREIKRKLEKAK